MICKNAFVQYPPVRYIRWFISALLAWEIEGKVHGQEFPGSAINQRLILSLSTSNASWDRCAYFLNRVTRNIPSGVVFSSYTPKGEDYTTLLVCMEGTEPTNKVILLQLTSLPTRCESHLNCFLCIARVTTQLSHWTNTRDRGGIWSSAGVDGCASQRLRGAVTAMAADSNG